jgi:hypothetical protein
MERQDKVPSITIETSGSKPHVHSNSAFPEYTADSAACWKPEAVKAARKVLKRSGEVICLDATAYCAMLSMSLDMMTHGREVKATLTKGWIG